MKVRVARNNFAEAVGTVVRSISARPTAAALGGMLLDTHNGQLRLAGYDQETASKTLISASVEEEGKVLVADGRKLAEIARSLPQAEVEISEEEGRVIVTCGTAKFRLPVLSVSDYPELPKLPPVVGKVAADAFAVAVSQVAVAAAKDNAVAELQSVRVEAGAEKLRLVATDRYRLAVKEIPWTGGEAEQAILVSAKALSDAARSFSDAGEALTLAFATEESASMVGFSTSTGAIITRLQAGDFPKYEKLLPTEFAATAEVDRAALTDAVKRVGLVVSAGSAVRLSFSANGVKLEAGEGEDADAAESISCSYTGEEMEVAFNPTYFLDGLSAVGGEKVAVKLVSSSKPAVLTGDGSMTYLIMPVRLG